MLVKMDKKSLISFNMIIWIPRIIFLVVVIMSIMLIVNLFIKTEIDTAQIEADLLLYQLVYSPHGISYHDPFSNRIYPGEIDITTSSPPYFQKILNISFYTKRKIAAKIEIQNLDTNQKTESFFDPWGRFSKWIVLEGIKGIGGVDVFRKETYVLLRDQNKVDKGLLKMTIVIPRS
jgi:hypothetical protein